MKEKEKKRKKKRKEAKPVKYKKPGVKCTWPSVKATIYSINTKKCQEHFKKLVIPFHFVSNTWEWDKKIIMASWECLRMR